MADLPWFLMSFSDKQTYFCYKMANKEIKIPSHKLIWMFSLIYFDRFIISNKLFFDDKGVSLLRIKMVIYFFFSILHICLNTLVFSIFFLGFVAECSFVWRFVCYVYIPSNGNERLFLLFLTCRYFLKFCEFIYLILLIII